jgi:hypothetical protein
MFSDNEQVLFVNSTIKGEFLLTWQVLEIFFNKIIAQEKLAKYPKDNSK